MNQVNDSINTINIISSSHNNENCSGQQVQELLFSKQEVSDNTPGSCIISYLQQNGLRRHFYFFSFSLFVGKWIIVSDTK